MKTRQISRLLAVPCFLIFAACTRATENTNASFSLSLPSTIQNGAAAVNGKLMHVAINVTGPGINPSVIFSWDAHQNGVEVTAPSSFNFEVPQGEARLIQALAVYEQDTTKSMVFTYGDVTTSMTAAEVSVTISLTEIGAGSVVSGRVSGRVLTSANAGPTGVVDVYFDPGNSKPALIVEKSFIANGWFSFFMLAGATLEYKVGGPSGASLFGGPVDLNSPKFIPLAANGNRDQVVRAAMPSFVRENGGVKASDKANINVWGFWSADSSLISGKMACNDLNAGSFTRVFRYASPASSASTLLTLANAAGADQSYPSNAALLNVASPMTSVTAGGGQVTACSSPVNVSYIPVRKNLIDGNGNDSVAGFRNIFITDSNGNTLTFVGTGTTATISGSVLPGIQSLFTGIRFFKRTGTAAEEFRIEVPMCQAIANGASGFVPAGAATSIDPSTGAFSAANVTIDTTSSDFTGGRMSIVACGAAGAGLSDLAPVGLFQGLYSGGGGAGKYMKIELTGAPSTGSTITATNGQCYPVNFKLYDNGSPFNATAAVTISNPNPGSTWYGLYTSATCSTLAGNTDLTINSGSNSYTGAPLYFKSTSVGSNQIFPSAVTSTDGIVFSSAQNAVTVGNPSLSINGPSNVIQWVSASQLCYPVTATRLDAAGMPMTSDANALSVSFAGSGFTLYGSSADCAANTSPLSTSFNISGAQSAQNLFMRATGTGSQTIIIPVNGMFPATSYTFNAYAPSSAHSANASRFMINPETQKAGLCNAVRITHVNSAGDEIPVPAPVSVKLNADSTDVFFYSDPMCNNQLADGIFNFSAGETSQKAYFLPSSAPGSSFVISGSTGSISGDSTTVTTTTPSAADEPYMIFTLPKIKSVLLGSHDFTTAKTITFSPSAGATISCEQASSPYSSWTPCSGQLAANTFSWSDTDALAGLGFRFWLNKSGQPPRSYSFIPGQLYSKWGQTFQVLSCGDTLNANATTDIADINTAHSSNTVVCLNAGTFTQTGSAVITTANNKVLIGKTDANGNPSTILQAVTAADLSSVNPGTSFANLDMRGAASGSGSYLVNLLDVAGANFKSYNNIYQVNAAHSIGIKSYGSNQAFDSYGDTFIVDGTTSSTYGMLTTNCVSCNSTMIKSPLFKLSSHASVGTTRATAIRYWTSSSTMQVFDAKIDPVLNDGSFLLIDNGGSQTANFTMTNSSLNLSGFGDNLNKFPIQIIRRANLTFNNVSIISNMASDTIRAVETYAASDLNMSFVDSKIVSLQDQRALFLNNTGTSLNQTIATSRTHFVRAGTAGNSSLAIQVAGSTGSLIWNVTGNSGEAPDTYFCGTAAGTNWPGIVTASAANWGGAPNPGLIAITNTADTSTWTCQ